MKKRFWLSAIAACGISLSAFGADSSEAMFNATMKNLDMGGETLYYQNANGLHSFINKTIPEIVNIATASMPQSAEKSAITNGMNSVIKLINISAFKASGASSKEVAPGIYDLKLFSLIDRTQKSILLPPTVPAKPLHWKNLPADTILAFSGNIDLGFVWQMLYQEMLNNPDPMIKMLAMQVEPLKQSGIDVNAMLNSVKGELKITVAASNKDNFCLSVTIPDAKGTVSAFMKRQLPPPDGNILTLPTPAGNVDITYLPGRINATLKSPAYTRNPGKLGDLPEFKSVAKFAPARGNGYLIISVSAKSLDAVRQNLPEEAKPMQAMFDKAKPVALFAVWNDTADGSKGQLISTFSIPQLQQSGAFFAPYAAILLPALNQARSRARQVSCTNNLKQFAIACTIYADGHKNTLPPTLGAVGKELGNSKILDDIVYLLPGVNMNKITNPAGTPLAICDRSDHSDNVVCVAFADGHVISMPVDKNAGEKEVVQKLITEHNIPQAIAGVMLKAVENDN